MVDLLDKRSERRGVGLVFEATLSAHDIFLVTDLEVVTLLFFELFHENFVVDLSFFGVTCLCLWLCGFVTFLFDFFLFLSKAPPL